MKQAEIERGTRSNNDQLKSGIRTPAQSDMVSQWYNIMVSQ